MTLGNLQPECGLLASSSGRFPVFLRGRLGRFRDFLYHRVEAKVEAYSEVKMDISNILSVVIVGCLFLIFPILTVKACVADARRRGKSPLLVTLAVFFFFPLGLILWLLFRPDPMDGGGRDRQFHLSNYRVP